MNLRITQANTLFASLDNVDVARLDMTLAPVNRSEPLALLIPGQLTATYPAPLPETLYLVRSSLGPSGANWTLQAEPPERPDFRLHTPGGLQLLYSEEPLLIVYGTMAWKERNEALRHAAELAAVSPNGSWSSEDAHLRDGVSAFKMPYGRHAVKADVDVTEEDIQNCNLLLLGDPRHNELIQRIQKEIPVQLNGTHIRTSDGHSWPFDGAVFGLLHYNPLASDRLIYWIAADETEDYGEGGVSVKRTLIDIQASSTGPAADFIILGASQTELLAARRFDSRWRWEAGYAQSPRFTESVPVFGPDAEIMAKVLRRDMGAHFGMTRARGLNSMNLKARAGVTRLADVRAMLYADQAGRCTLTGQQVLALQERFKKQADPATPLGRFGVREMGKFVPAPVASEIDLTAYYQVAMPARQILPAARITGIDGQSFSYTDRTIREAWGLHAPAVLAEQKKP
jgi:hypothetical protein